MQYKIIFISNKDDIYKIRMEEGKIFNNSFAMDIPKGVIIAWRHIHTPTPMAKELGLCDKQLVKVKLGTVRALIFENVLIRVRDDFSWELHIDTDEANAAMVKTGDIAELILEPTKITANI
jgi:putative phosphotransacetylase